MDMLIDFTLLDELLLDEVKAKFPVIRKPLNSACILVFGSMLLKRFCSLGLWSAFDAKVITFSGKYAISSPNMAFVPSYIFGKAKLCACKDGHWGYLNPFQTPQEWSKEFAWAPLIPRKGKVI
jgi:hypothetical protein